MLQSVTKCYKGVTKLLNVVTKCYKSVKCCYKVLQKCQFSYLQGSQRNGEYSSDFVNLSKETSNIGAFCNWFEIVNDSNTNDESVFFKGVKCCYKLLQSVTNVLNVITKCYKVLQKC